MIRLADARICADCEVIYLEANGTHCPVCCSPATVKLDNWLKTLHSMVDILARMGTLHKDREEKKKGGKK